MVTNLDGTKELAINAASSIKHVIETCGPRHPASDGERKALEYIESEMRQCVDTTIMEAFKVMPSTFESMTVIVGILMVCSTIAYWIFPLASLVLMASALFIEAFTFFFYTRILDAILPKRLSHNLTCIKKPKGAMKKRIILSAHVDASRENRFSKPVNAKVLVIGLMNFVITIAISCVASIFNFAWNGGYANAWGILGIIVNCFIPIQVMVFFYYRHSSVAPGANDNLSGTFVVAAVAKYFARNANHLENTEIWYVFTGSEEAGLRGAMQHAKAHAAGFQDVDTKCIVLDTMKDLDSIFILTSDLNGFVKLDPNVSQLLQQASKNIGREIEFHPFPFGAGSTDAAAFQQKGIPASAIVAMKQPTPFWYHTRHDNHDILNVDCIEFTLRICIEAVKLFDVK